MKYLVIMRLTSGSIAEYTTWVNFTREEIIKKATSSYGNRVSKIIGIF